MSISLWDPFGTRRHYGGYAMSPFGGRQRFVDPFDITERQLQRSMNMIDRFFDQDMNLQVWAF